MTEMKNLKKRNLVIIASITAVLAIAVIGITVDSISLHDNSIQDTDQTNYAIRGPGKSPLIEYGSNVSVDAARSVTGFSKVSFPTDTINGLNLESVRVRDYPPSYLVTGFYTPNGIKATDTDSFEDILESGGIVVLYNEEPNSPDYDPQKWRDGFVNQASDVRKLDAINGYPAIIVSGNPAKGINSEVYVYVDNLQIGIISAKHNVNQLILIADTITQS